MSDVTLAITAPTHGSTLNAPVALRGTATGNTAGLFFKWFSSLNANANATHPELLPTDYTTASLAGGLTALAEFGTHTVVLAATDQLGIALPAIQAVKRAALAGGAPPASPAPCVVHQLAGVTLRTPAAPGASLSKAGATIEFLAPGNWTDAGYRQVNGIALHLHLAPVSGATVANSADVPLDLPALPVFTADAKVWLRYAGPLPGILGVGAHVLSLVATAGNGSLAVTRQVTLTA
ncbi:MAG: hypothetical protein JF607_04825 [Burkholderiales bacterium]|jgi:hypothetical protein|nr:hypothetical protein [Burkholderiales bacterium]